MDQPLVPQLSDCSMQLLLEELQWAHRIKKAIAKSEELIRPVSDYECALWAIVTIRRQSIGEVLERAYKYQCFQDELKLHGNSMEEGMKLIEDFHKLLPGAILRLDFLPDDGHYLMVFDYARFTPKVLKSVENWRSFMGGARYMFHVVNSSFQSTREGLVLIAECEGMGFGNYDSQVEERFMTDLVSYIPLKHKESYWLRTPMVANIALACLKPFLPEEFQSNVHLGCRLDGFEERVDVLLQTPTPEIAERSMMQHTKAQLQLRIDNQNHYILPPLTDRMILALAIAMPHQQREIDHNEDIFRIDNPYIREE